MGAGRTVGTSCVQSFNGLFDLSTLLLAPAPAVLFCVRCQRQCIALTEETAESSNGFSWIPSCHTWQQHPLATVNQLLFWNMCVVFWLLSSIRRSTWLIDPYWTIIPVLIEAYYILHPAAPFTTRSMLASALITTWSVRLSWLYFRREKWQLGKREDWRFADLRQQHGKHFWWTSFFVTYLSQHAMLLSLTLPLYSASFSKLKWSWTWDGAAVVSCLTGLLIAYHADTSLDQFVTANERRQAQGKPKQPLLNTGLWKYSRHPNHFGEQLFWWGLALFAISSGDSWTLIGPLFNSICMVHVTKLVESRMLKQQSRALLYQQYQHSTSMWIPWWPKQHAR